MFFSWTSLKKEKLNAAPTLLKPLVRDTPNHYHTQPHQRWWWGSLYLINATKNCQSENLTTWQLTTWQSENLAIRNIPPIHIFSVNLLKPERVGWCCWRICIESSACIIFIITRLVLLIPAIRNIHSIFLFTLPELVLSASGWVCWSWLCCIRGGCVMFCIKIGCVVSELVGLAVLDQDWLPEGSAWRFALLLRLPLTPMGQGLEYVELWKVGKWIIAETKNVCLFIKMVVVVFVLLLVLHNVLFFDVNTSHSRSRKCFDLLKQ